MFNYMPNRTEKLNKLLHEEISEIINSEIEFESGILVTVTGVDVSPDLSQAKIGLSVLPFEKTREVIGKIVTERYHIINELNKKIKLKKIPKLIFINDDTEEEASKVEKIINEI